MHPAAVIKGAGLASIARRLDEATAEAARAGVLDVPAVLVADHVFHGDAELGAAAAALRERAA
jgi:2-hydroxychromene-2-carboxylate isomerase